MAVKFLMLFAKVRVFWQEPSSKTLVESLNEKYISGYHHLQCPAVGPRLVVQVRSISPGLNMAGLQIHFFAFRGSSALGK